MIFFNDLIAIFFDDLVAEQQHHQPRLVSVGIHDHHEMLAL